MDLTGDHTTYFDRIWRFIVVLFLLVFVITTILAIPFFGIKKAILFGIIGGIALSILGLPLGGMDYFLLSKMIRKYGTVDYNTHQLRTMNVSLPPDKTYDIILKVVKRLKGPEVTEVHKDNKVIKMQSKPSLLTFGEEIAINILSDSEGASIVRLTSKPRIGSTIIDYGKNYENVESICSIIKHEIGSWGPTA